MRNETGYICYLPDWELFPADARAAGGAPADPMMAEHETAKEV